jgi:hypothetical protein
MDLENLNITEPLTLEASCNPTRTVTWHSFQSFINSVVAVSIPKFSQQNISTYFFKDVNVTVQVPCLPCFCKLIMYSTFFTLVYYKCWKHIFLRYNQQYVTFLNLFISITLYVFQVEPPPIIRSSDCTYSFWYLSNLAATCCDHGLTNTRSCTYSPSSWWWVEVPPETCRALLK